MRRQPHWPVILSIAAVKFLFHLYASGYYNYFRDELYYIACGRHLDWGFVDHPPLVAVYARIGELFGPSLRGFRLLATIAGALRIVLTGVITARLGGNRIAQALACTAVLIAPIFLALDSFLSMNPFEHLYWLACLLIVLEIANGASEKWWLAFGAIAGVGLQNKHSMLFIGAAIVVAMLFTPMRRSLARPWIWLGGAIALLLFAPNLIWQMQHGFPTLELLRNVKETGKNVVLAPGPFMVQQAMMLNPFTAPLWIAGLIALFRNPRHRVLAWTYVVVLALFLRLEAKDYYLAPIYPLLFAAGAVWFSTRRRAIHIGAFAIVIAGGLISMPLATPILSPPRYLAYQRALGVEPQQTEVSHTSEMPQLFSDQFGWEETVAKVGRYYHSLPEAERRKTAIFCGNYGQAGAIDFYGPKYGLPPAISGHQHYFLWGHRGYSGESVILLDDDPDPDRELWTSLTKIDQRFHPYAMPSENAPIFHGRGMKTPLAQLWPRVKQWR
ncbi:MAG TPA: glycosyltransferase family 39 protein [Thermoanaerobaculia bacterium]|nr:glycosyltransferase family 39 protein [Thermoanaerobaculia bacterium]